MTAGNSAMIQNLVSVFPLARASLLEMLHLAHMQSHVRVCACHDCLHKPANYVIVSLSVDISCSLNSHMGQSFL